MLSIHPGFLFALGTMTLWSISPFFFASAGRRIGPFATNAVRLLLASAIYVALCALQWALLPAAHWPHLSPTILLAASGIVGLSFGDYFYYRSLSTAGPERTSLMMLLTPACTALLAWVFIRERLSSAQLAGMVLVLGGVAAAAWPGRWKKASSLWTGSGNGAIASLCQGIGAVLARQAFLSENDFPPLAAAALRIISAAIVLTLAAGWRGNLGAILRRAREPIVSRRLIAGACIGPVGGMLGYVAALRDEPAGIVTTIIFMTPLLVLPLGVWRYGTRLSPRTLLGGAAALAGVVLLGLES